MTGIYRIVNILNGKLYIGSSKNCDERFYKHTWKLKSGIHENFHLQNAWIKYGQENFKFELIDECDVKDLLTREHDYLSMAKTGQDMYYNPNYSAICPPNPSGRKFSDATKLKLSILRKGKNNPRFGKTHSITTKQKMSEVRSKEYVLLSPTNQVIFIKNMSKFCEEHGLNEGGMHGVCKGRYIHYKGWRKI